MGTDCPKSLFYSNQSSALFHFFFSFDLVLDDEKQKYKYLNVMANSTIVSPEDGFLSERGHNSITRTSEENVFRNGVCCRSERKGQDVSCQTIL